MYMYTFYLKRKMVLLLYTRSWHNIGSGRRSGCKTWNFCR